MKPRYELDGQYITIYDQGGKELYDFNLNRVTTSAQLLDWIYQVKTKRWCTPHILAAVVDGFDSACRRYLNTTVQGAFCSCGQDLKVKWPSFKQQ
jgi:hypothetical protein